MSTKADTLAPFFFHQGKNYKAYEFMGCHAEMRQGGEGATYVFRVWAPRAVSVFVTGDFNGWSNDAPMKRISGGGIWETKLDAALFSESRVYKYKICSPEGEFLRADPYAVYVEPLQGGASLVGEIPQYKWRDDGWMRFREKTGKQGFCHRPLNIYEVHLDSWKRREDGSCYAYAELASELACYVKQMGYTHVQLLPIMERLFGKAAEYEICGFYAPTARYGTPEGFMQFVDIMHEAGIGVILDWVPAYFSGDAQGLLEFDGNPLYECQSAEQREHFECGCRRFDVGRNEVACFLISNAAYWAACYHIDGLRLCGVDDMIFLHRDRKPRDWISDACGDNKNLEAIAFLKKFKDFMKESYPDLLVIADEPMPKELPRDKEEQGTFLTWNRTRIDDILTYATLEPHCKKYGETVLSFSRDLGGHNVLAISHEEVAHGKKSFLEKMPGDYWQKFAGVRTFFSYIMTHPGKKLIFMGCEIGQFCEWDSRGQVEWLLLEHDAHAKLQFFFARMNHFYLTHPALWENDDFPPEVSPLDPVDRGKVVLSYTRVGKSGEELVVVINFTPDVYHDYEVCVSQEGTYEELVNSDDVMYGGSGIKNDKDIVSEVRLLCDNQHIIKITVPPLAACIFQRKEDKRAPEDTKVPMFLNDIS